MFGNGDGKKPFQTNFTFNQNVTSNNQSGGITAHTVNLGPQARNMSDPWAARIKQQINDLPRDKPITVLAVMGDGEAAEFAVQLHAYLKAAGFQMASGGIAQSIFSQPPTNLAVHDEADGLTFIVGHHRP